MSDNTKKAARHVQHETGMTYSAALNIIRGDSRPIPQVPGCQVRMAFATMNEKVRAHLQLPQLGEPAEGKPAPKPCRCVGCDP